MLTEQQGPGAHLVGRRFEPGPGGCMERIHTSSITATNGTVCELLHN